MKVRELQEKLSKLDPELEVVCYSEDKKQLVEGRGFILLDIMAVNMAEAERLRLNVKNRKGELKDPGLPGSLLFIETAYSPLF